MKMTIEIRFVADPRDPFPLYCKYANELQPQRAYIALDPAARTVDAGYNGEIGNGIPCSVFNGKIYRWKVPADLPAASVLSFIDEHSAFFDAVCDGYTEVYDGCNYVGRLNDSAQAASDELEQLAEALQASEDRISVCDTAEYIQEQGLCELLTEGYSLQQAAGQLLEDAGADDDCHVTGLDAESCVDAIVEKARGYNGDIPERMKPDLLPLEGFDVSDFDDFEDDE
jgi:hypothetical protein